MNYDELNELSIQEAIASSRIEGLPVTADIERRIRRILSGEVSLEERIRQIKEKQRVKRV
ncbi:MAG: antitoxin VbhA family protein [Angelakisella sp.]|jgi:hypothetical protein|nr:antitoxin VbhA family protein [Angelakisella sp.]